MTLCLSEPSASITLVTTTTTCTVVVRGDGSRCGEPAVTSFTSSRTGEVFAECEAHRFDVAVGQPIPQVETCKTLGIPTRTRQPYAIVAHGRIVGYVAAITDRSQLRAFRLGGRIVPVR